MRIQSGASVPYENFVGVESYAIEASDVLSDFLCFTSGARYLYYSGPENRWKKCSNGVLTDLDTTDTGLFDTCTELSTILDPGSNGDQTSGFCGKVVLSEYPTLNYPIVTGGLFMIQEPNIHPSDCVPNLYDIYVDATGTWKKCMNGALTDLDTTDTTTFDSCTELRALVGGTGACGNVVYSEYPTIQSPTIVDQLNMISTDIFSAVDCTAGHSFVYVDTSENKWKKCTNGTLSDLDTLAGYSTCALLDTDLAVGETTGMCGDVVLSNAPTFQNQVQMDGTLAVGPSPSPTPTATKTGSTPTPTGVTPTPTATTTVVPGQVFIRNALCIGCPEGTAPRTEIEIVADTDTVAALTLSSHASSALSQSQMIFQKARGTALAPTAAQSGDVLGTLGFRGFNGSAFSANTAAVTAQTLETFTGSALGTSVNVTETYAGTSAASNAARFKNGHLIFFGTAPVVTGCGTIASQVGNDKAGRFTSGTGAITTCTVTFNKAYDTNAPVCLVQNQTTGVVLANTPSTTTFTFAGAVSSVYNYLCVGVE